MPKLCRTTLRLLGPFAVEANAGRALSVSVRSKKARALLAYLAMKPDGRASREELATLLWGDNPDAQARHSLRQCVMSLRHDLHLAPPEILIMDREAIELREHDLAVDTREFMSLARSARPDELRRAAELWRGAFLADLTLDIEEFDAWRQREQDRLAAAAAHVFEALSADPDGDGERAIEAADRLVALDPTREDRQRSALKVYARYRGREAALDRARLLTNLLRSELAVSPDAATRALIAAIKNGELEQPRPQALVPAPAAALADSAPDGAVDPARETAAPRGTAVAVVAAEQAISVSPPAAAASNVAYRHRGPVAAALAVISAIAIGAVAALGLAAGTPFSWQKLQLNAGAVAKPGLASAVVLPFSVDAPQDAQDQAFARLLTHELTADLGRFDLRMISDQTADLYRDRQVDVAKVGAELDVPYVVVGRVQRTAGGLRTEVQLIDAASRVTLWSDQMQRESGEAAQLANEIARGFARVLVIHVAYAEARRIPRDPGRPASVGELLLRGRVIEAGSHNMRSSVSAALGLYEEALRLAPHNTAAMLGVARLNLVAAMNFIDLASPPDIPRAEKLLNEVLARSPNSANAHFTLAMLQKYRGQYEAATRSAQRCLELNPSFLPARGQIAILLTRTGQPEKGLEAIQETIRLATPNDPSMGFWYLFAGEAELELGHEQAALGWMLRANVRMPGSPLVQAWLAAVYATMGDRSNTAKYVAALKRIAPAGAERFAAIKFKADVPATGWRRPRILEGLRLALGESLG